MRLPTWYKLTSLSLYLSQLKHTLMSAMMSNKSCQRIKLNILLKTRVIWKFVFSEYLCGGLCRATIKAQRHCVVWGEDRGVSLVIVASPSLARGDMHWRCTDALLSYCLSKLVVWKLRTFRMQPTRNNTRLQNPAGSVGGVLHGPLSRRVALGGNRCHYWHFLPYNYSSPFQQGEEVHKSNFSIIKILKSD